MMIINKWPLYEDEFRPYQLKRWGYGNGFANIHVIEPDDAKLDQQLMDMGAIIEELGEQPEWVKVTDFKTAESALEILIGDVWFADEAQILYDE